MRFDFGDVVLVPFPFTSQTAFKKRAGRVRLSEPENHSRMAGEPKRWTSSTVF
jgi:hypothetical protein